MLIALLMTTMVFANDPLLSFEGSYRVLEVNGISYPEEAQSVVKWGREVLRSGPFCGDRHSPCRLFHFRLARYDQEIPFPSTILNQGVRRLDDGKVSIIYHGRIFHEFGPSETIIMTTRVFREDGFINL